MKGNTMNEMQKEFTLSREYNAPRDVVFKAWTDPALVRQWWGPEGVFIPVCELDVRPGGSMNIVMEAGESLGSFKGTQWPMTGTYEAIEEPSKIIFVANAINEGKEVLQHRTVVTFEEKDAKTTMTVHVTVTKTLPGSEFAVAGMEQGWNSQCDKLGKFLGNKK